MADNTDMDSWTVDWVSPAPVVPSGVSITAQGLLAREEASRIRLGSPFMTRPDGHPDPWLTRYFNAASFQRLRRQSQESYMTNHRLFFNFLWRRGKDWHEATPDDYEDWEHWRRRSGLNPARIAGSTWERDVAAHKRLYLRAVADGVMERSPVTVTTRVGRDGREHTSADASAHDRRASNVKWLTPRASKRWRDVGLLGLDADGLPRSSFRARLSDRNAGYADLLFDSGLRRGEAGSLLDIELPVICPERQSSYLWGRLAVATAKYGSGRPFCVTTATVRSINGYVATTRAASIARAQRRGTYDAMPEQLLVTRIRSAPDPILEWVSTRTGTVHESPLDRIPIEERVLLMREGNLGIEPLWVWLSEGGTPFLPSSWEDVFTSASERCRMVLGDGAPYCTPHMARHSFALQMLLAMQHALDKRYDLSPAQRRDYELLYGNPWRMVRDLLGHRSEETTRKVYLAPVRDVQVRTLLEGDLAAGADFLQALAAASGRVQDVTT